MGDPGSLKHPFFLGILSFQCPDNLDSPQLPFFVTLLSLSFLPSIYASSLDMLLGVSFNLTFFQKCYASITSSKRYFPFMQLEIPCALFVLTFLQISNILFMKISAFFGGEPNHCYLSYPLPIMEDWNYIAISTLFFVSNKDFAFLYILLSFGKASFSIPPSDFCVSFFVFC